MTYRFDTIQVHGGHIPDSSSLARTVPIYQSTSFVFRETSHAASLFALETEGNIYSRIGNPTVGVLEQRVTLLESGLGAVATASGSSAILYAIINIAKAGDEIISSRYLYGGTYHLFKSVLKDMGIYVHLVDIHNLQGIESAITDKTRAIFTETIGNPTNTVADIKALSDHHWGQVLNCELTG